MNLSKKLLCLILAVVCLIGISGCAQNKKENIVIYSSADEATSEYTLKRLKEEFPDYNVTLQYMSTGNNAAKLKAEGKNTDCDIVFELETPYMEMLKENFASLEAYDFERYMDEVIPKEKKYAPYIRSSGAFIINEELLKEKGLKEPKTYEDLLKPEYKGLVSMPNPKASSTGYMFLKSRINELGEEAAFTYFDQLSKNIYQFTSSGSGPVNALIQGEAVIGLGMTYQAVNEINAGVPLKIIFPPSGSPYSTYAIAMIDGKQDKPAVKEVFDFIYNELVYEDKEKIAPEKIFKEQDSNLENYPQDIPYADMTGVNDFAEKESILAKWEH